jgi:hypothetical protein
MSQTETWRHTVLVKEGKSNEEAVAEIFPELAGQGAYADKAGMVRVPVKETEPEEETIGLPPVVEPLPVIPEVVPEPTVTPVPVTRLPWWIPLLGLVPVVAITFFVFWTWPKPVPIEQPKPAAILFAPTMTPQPTWTPVPTSTPAPTQTAVVVVQTVVVQVPVQVQVQAPVQRQQIPAQPVQRAQRVVQPSPQPQIRPQSAPATQVQPASEGPYIATGLDWIWRSIFDTNLDSTADCKGPKLKGQPSRSCY